MDRKRPSSEMEKGCTADTDLAAVSALADDGSTRADRTKRVLKPRHVQLLSIGGVIGTLMFVGIGKTLVMCGPASLLIAFTFW